MNQHTETVAEGIVRKHSRACSAPAKRCNCKPSYLATAKASGQRVRKTYRNLAEAKSWRADTLAKMQRGEVRAATKLTLREFADDWIDGAEAGRIRNRSGRLYKPSVIRSYRRALDRRILPALGDRKLAEIRRGDIKRGVIEPMIEAGWSGSTIRNALNPLQAILRDALDDELIAVNPIAGLKLPAPNRRARGAVDLEDAFALVDALPADQRALWATTFYTGLRRGELRALRCSDLDFDSDELHVRASWDDAEGRIEVKSDAGYRVAPILPQLRPILLEHLAATGRRGDDLIFGRTANEAFVPSTVNRRARKAWKDAGIEVGETTSAHMFRHTMSSTLQHAGASTRGAMDLLGHASSAMTIDTYGHTSPAERRRIASQVSDYLDDNRKAAGE